MTVFRIAIGVLAIAALTACANPDRFNDDTTSDSSFDDVTDVTSVGDGSDPTSPTYFSETVGDRVLFLVDQTTLSPAAQGILQQQAAWLMQNPEYNARIEGHADEQGTRVYNFNLGERRANAVREFLISQGVAGSRVTTISYGKERPLEICSDETCYAQNRRAVTVLSAGPIS